MNNLQAVAFDNFNRPIMWQDSSNRLYVNVNGTATECDQNGVPLNQGNNNPSFNNGGNQNNNGNFDQNGLEVIELDRNRNPILWRDRNNRIYELDRYNNLQEVIQNQPNLPAASGYNNNGSFNNNNNNVNGFNPSMGNNNGGNTGGSSGGSRKYRDKIAKTREVEEHFEEQIIHKPVEPVIKSLASYTPDVDSEAYPLIDESLYTVDIFVNDANRTFKYKINRKG